MFDVVWSFDLVSLLTQYRENKWKRKIVKGVVSTWSIDMQTLVQKKCACCCLCDVVGWVAVGCLLLVAVVFVCFPFIQTNAESSLLCQNSLFPCFSLSCLVFSFSHVLSLLCLLFHTHSYSSIYTSWSTENSSVCFSTCWLLHRTHATQWQPFSLLTICTPSCMQTLSHSTKHSLIHCHYHRHMLSYHETWKLGQISQEHNMHTETDKCWHITHFWLQILASFTRYEPVI